MIPPQYFGGNMDNRLHGIGARVYLPVNVRGALLSLADPPHASQGDGEVTGTAIETSATVRIRVNVIKGMGIKRPFTVAPVRMSPPTSSQPWVYQMTFTKRLGMRLRIC